jgi:phospholipase C
MLIVRYVSLALGFTASALALAACSAATGSSSAMLPQPVNPQRAHGVLLAGGDPASGGSSKIKHVVIVVQENRSFNNLFMGYPGATTQNYGYISTGKKVMLKPILLESDFLPGYGVKDFFLQCNGTGSIPGTDCQMNGFDQVPTQCGGGHCPLKYPPYSYVKRSEIKPYWDMANQYVLADQMYASNIDESSFISHQYIIAAQAMQAYNWPSSTEWGCEAPYGTSIPILGPQRQYPIGREGVCFNDVTLGQEADEAGVTWASYSAPIGTGENSDGGVWQGYQANNDVYYGKDWKNDIIQNPARFLTDVSKGKLRQITWITPTNANSDHPENQSNTGPMWVASVVNSIGKSQFWDSTAIFIFWDDPSGFFDPEPPPYVDYDGLGFRLPLLIISPYAKQDYVSHVQFEHGSILKFTEDIFGLARLSASDTRATSPASDCFDFNQPPRKFKAIPSQLDERYFIRQPLDYRPVDTH